MIDSITELEIRIDECKKLHRDVPAYDFVFNGRVEVLKAKLAKLHKIYEEHNQKLPNLNNEVVK